jgi:plasmid stabilization system protein ParE
MAGELIWALEALDDIDAIARYIVPRFCGPCPARRLGDPRMR